MRGLLTSVAAICFSAPAIAADFASPSAPYVLPPAPLAYDWTGVYVGGQFGWAFAHSATTTTDSLTGAFLGSGDSDKTTFHGGGQIGYDFMTMSRIVVGAQASLVWGQSTTTTSTNAAGTNASTSSSASDMAGTVNGRLGYAFGDLMPYATGGWAWANGNVTRTQDVGVTGLATPGTAEQQNVFRNGWDVGGGLEYRLWDNWTVFGEYRYTQYGAVSVTFPLAERSNSTSTTANAVNVGVNYKF